LGFLALDCRKNQQSPETSARSGRRKPIGKGEITFPPFFRLSFITTRHQIPGHKNNMTSADFAHPNNADGKTMIAVKASSPFRKKEQKNK
jgi:hypothetical protein